MERVKEILNRENLILVLLIGIFCLLIDGPRLKREGKIKELKVLKLISYFYIIGGIILFVITGRKLGG